MQVKADFATIRDTVNTYAVFIDVARTITAVQTFSATPVFNAGVTVVGNSTITGTLGGITVLTITTSATINAVAVAVAAGTIGKIPRYTAAAAFGDSGMTDNGTFTSNANQPRARVVTGVAIGTVSGAITWSAAALNVGTIWAVGNPTRLTIPANAGGSYRFACQLDIKHDSASASFSLTLLKNGATTIVTFPAITVTTLTQYYSADTVDDPSAADYYEWQLNGGDAVNMTIQSATASINKVW